MNFVNTLVVAEFFSAGKLKDVESFEKFAGTDSAEEEIILPKWMSMLWFLLNEKVNGAEPSGRVDAEQEMLERNQRSLLVFILMIFTRACILVKLDHNSPFLQWLLSPYFAKIPEHVSALSAKQLIILKEKPSVFRLWKN